MMMITAAAKEEQSGTRSRSMNSNKNRSKRGRNRRRWEKKEEHNVGGGTIMRSDMWSCLIQSSAVCEKRFLLVVSVQPYNHKRMQ